jgi:hypothetical protein
MNALEIIVYTKTENKIIQAVSDVFWSFSVFLLIFFIIFSDK